MSYQLSDSGSEGRLERFGEIALSRPSSVAVWDRRDPTAWRQAAASYRPKGGWEFSGPFVEGWVASIGGVKLHLELQSNGQIGVFPEHAVYLDSLDSLIRALSRPGRPCRVLNLFAYTGMGTVRAALAGAEVTHIDKEKRALTWARRNLELNNVPSDKVRLIPEDASTFLQRESRRGNRYDIVIADPPSFSRISKNVSWTLEAMLRQLTLECLDVLDAERGALFMTNHSSVFTNDIVCNLLHDRCPKDSLTLEQSTLVLREADSPRVYPAGSLVMATVGLRG